MPTYEFRCPDGHEFERFYRKISDAPPDMACPECGKPAERKLSGGAGLHFKGSGFYLTDYGKNAHRKSGSASGSGNAKGGGETPSATSDGKSADATGSESKPAESKAESKPTDTKASGTAGASSSINKTTDK